MPSDAWLAAPPEEDHFAIVLLIIIGTIFGKVGMFIDFALAYALLNFLGTLAAARFCHAMSVTDHSSEPTPAKRARRIS